MEQMKGQLVACGYAQIIVVDFDETYSHVARLTRLRIVFPIAMQPWLRLHQMDVDLKNYSQKHVCM